MRFVGSDSKQFKIPEREVWSAEKSDGSIKRGVG